MAYNLSIGELIDRVSIANIKIWHLEQAISEARDKKRMEEVGKMALQVRELNTDRSELRAEINKRMNDSNQGSNKIEYHGIGRNK